MEDTLFPSPMSNGSAKELEEERRLFYVALTRAEKQATLSYARNRYKWGNLETSNPSRFLRELDPKFLHYPQTGGKPFNAKRGQGDKPSVFRDEPTVYKPETKLKKISKPAGQPATSFSGTNSARFSEGDMVMHERFGNGVIVSIEGEPPNNTATVDFDKEGKKKLLLRFAKLKKV
jgi:DNA helicase-2/ATP-dependent DNA helicase PcrA